MKPLWKRPVTALIGALMVFSVVGAVTTAPTLTEPAAADYSDCDISGAARASWGCGRTTNEQWDRATIKLQAHTGVPGGCIRLQYQVGNSNGDRWWKTYSQRFYPSSAYHQVIYFGRWWHKLRIRSCDWTESRTIDGYNSAKN